MSDSLLFDLQQELAATKQQLAGSEAALKLALIRSRHDRKALEAAEQAIRESLEEVAHSYALMMPDHLWMRIGSNQYESIRDEDQKMILYAKPMIIPQSAEQLHIKELREALEWYIAEDDTNGGDEWEDINKYWLDGKRKAESLLAKQPDTRALEKALLEARIETLNHCSGRMVICADSDTARAYKNGFNDKTRLLNRMLSDYKEKLAELNKV